MERATDSVAALLDVTDLAQVNAEFRDQTPEALIAWAADTFGGGLALTCSFSGAAGMVLLDMTTRLGRGTPVIFLDTDLLFLETYALAERAARRYNLTIERRRPVLTLEEQAERDGSELWGRDPDRCCGIRKVAPLANALKPYRAWMSGIRRDQSATRAATQLVEWNAKHRMVKISPLAHWSERDVWRYIAANDVPYNPLLDQGFPSIGCTPCTRSAADADGRAGRWAGFAKVECGIHI